MLHISKVVNINERYIDGKYIKAVDIDERYIDVKYIKNS